MMTRAKKRVGVYRFIFAANVKARMGDVYRDSRDKPRALAKRAGVGLSTVQRILTSDVGASLDNIEHIATALESSVIDLLTLSAEARRALKVDILPLRKRNERNPGKSPSPPSTPSPGYRAR